MSWWTQKAGGIAETSLFMLWKGVSFNIGKVGYRCSDSDVSGKERQGQLGGEQVVR